LRGKIDSEIFKRKDEFDLEPGKPVPKMVGYRDIGL
jgi:hypothetical protein